MAERYIVINRGFGWSGGGRAQVANTKAKARAGRRQLNIHVKRVTLRSPGFKCKRGSSFTKSDGFYCNKPRRAHTRTHTLAHVRTRNRGTTHYI